MEIKFKDETARVTRLHQWYTYEGLLEGVPHDKLNKRILKALPERATAITYIDKYFLVKPKQTPIDLGRKYPFGKPMSLPGIVCVIGLKCSATSDPEIGGISELTLIAFQDNFGPPFSPEILEKVAKINWFDHARDVSWDEF